MAENAKVKQMKMDAVVHSKHHASPGTFISACLQICDSGLLHIQIPVLCNLNFNYIDNTKFTQELRTIYLWHIKQYFLVIM